MGSIDKSIHADRIAEERSEGEGMPEHPAKARDPARWDRTRPRRVARTLRHPKPDLLGLVIGAQLAVLTFVALLGPRRV